MYRMPGFLIVCVGLSAALSGFFSSSQTCYGQKKYSGPEDPRVKAICDRAVEYLRGTNSGIAAKTVGALAVVEYGKRYDGVVPTDDPYVVSAVNELVAMVDGGSTQIFDNKETYFPALALILLAEFDAKKYESQCVKGCFGSMLTISLPAEHGHTKPVQVEATFRAEIQFIAPR